MAVRKTTTKTKKKTTKTAKTEEVHVAPDFIADITKPPKSVTISKGKMVIGVAIVAFAAILYFLRGFFVVATVNGSPITRLMLIQKLESQGGQQTLESLITEKLILQEATEQNVSVSQEKLDSELAGLSEDLEAQGQTLEQALALQGLSEQDLLEQIRIQKLLERMVLGDTGISDEDIAAFLEENAEGLSEVSDPKELDELARQQLVQQRLSEELQPWLAELREKASVNFWVNF